MAVKKEGYTAVTLSRHRGRYNLYLDVTQDNNVVCTVQYLCARAAAMQWQHAMRSPLTLPRFIEKGPHCRGLRVEDNGDRRDPKLVPSDHGSGGQRGPLLTDSGVVVRLRCVAICFSIDPECSALPSW